MISKKRTTFEVLFFQLWRMVELYWMLSPGYRV